MTGNEHLEYVLTHFRHYDPERGYYLTFEDVIKRAIQIYAHRDLYAYLYGCDGQTADIALIERQVMKYPGHFINRDIEAIKAYTVGKTVFDCSGFIHTIFGAPDRTARGIIAECTDVTSDLASGVEGSCLYKPGHIGLDIGHGCFIHIASELQTFRLEVIREYDWSKSGIWSEYADYTGANNE